VTLAELLAAGLLTAGQTLHFIAAGYSASATVERAGKLLMNGREHWAVPNARGNFVPLAEIRTKFVEARAHKAEGESRPSR
jgi:hypothetical protein